MESMKEQLQAVRDAFADVEKAAERVDRAKSRAEGTQARLYDGMSGDGNSKRYYNSDALEELQEAQEELAECICFWDSKLRPMQEIYNKLPALDLCKLIISYRYLYPKLFTWEEIAARLELSYKHCLSLQKKAFELMTLIQQEEQK